MPDSPHLGTALLIASVVVGCDPIAPANEDTLDPVERAAEREALTAFYINTDGDNWTDRAGWLVGADPCRWFGVACTGERVFRLIMESNNLTGSLPAELGSLIALGDVRLNSNNLTGSIPAELGNLSALTTLLLDSNALSGVVPLPVAVLGGELQQIDPSRCGFESNPGLSMPDSQDYVDADLDDDGFICGVALSTPSP